jgi:hypothetical protein
VGLSPNGAAGARKRSRSKDVRAQHAAGGSTSGSSRAGDDATSSDDDDEASASGQVQS